jgi:hypothetical protein
VLFVWTEVTTALVFKRDCLTVDLICMAFGSAAGVVEINEEMQEWQNVVRSLPQYLPGCLSQEAWFLQVAVPAFEPNPVCIFRRDGAPVEKLQPYFWQTGLLKRFHSPKPCHLSI